MQFKKANRAVTLEKKILYIEDQMRRCIDRSPMSFYPDMYNSRNLKLVHRRYAPSNLQMRDLIRRLRILVGKETAINAVNTIIRCTIDVNKAMEVHHEEKTAKG